MDVDPIPATPISKILGLIEILDDKGGKESIYSLSKELNFEFGELLAVIKAGEILGFVETPGAKVQMTKLGKKLIEGDINQRKIIVKEQLKKLSLFKYFINFLKKLQTRSIPSEIIMEEIALHLPNENTESIFKTMLDWGRYGELFGYNSDTDLFYLDSE